MNDPTHARHRSPGSVRQEFGGGLERVSDRRRCRPSPRVVVETVHLVCADRVRRGLQDPVVLFRGAPGQFHGRAKARSCTGEGHGQMMIPALTGQHGQVLEILWEADEVEARHRQIQPAGQVGPVQAHGIAGVAELMGDPGRAQAGHTRAPAIPGLLEPPFGRSGCDRCGPKVAAVPLDDRRMVLHGGDGPGGGTYRLVTGGRQPGARLVVVTGCRGHACEQPMVLWQVLGTGGGLGDRDGDEQVVTSPIGIIDGQGQPCRATVQFELEPVIDLLGGFQRCTDPSVALCGVPELQPEPPDGGSDPSRVVPTPAQDRPQVVLVGMEPVEPVDLVWSGQSWCRVFREGGESLGVAFGERTGI